MTQYVLVAGLSKLVVCCRLLRFAGKGGNGEWSQGLEGGQGLMTDAD